MDSDWEAQREALEQKADGYADQRDALSKKRDLCLSLRKSKAYDARLVDQLNKSVQFTEEDVAVKEALLELALMGVKNLKRIVLIALPIWLLLFYISVFNVTFCNLALLIFIKLAI